MIDSDPKRIVQERLIAAPPAAVFDAWRDPESIRVWMCPDPEMSEASVEVDFRVGGRFRIVMHGAEQDYDHTGEYVEIDPPRRLVFTWISHFIRDAEQRTRVTLELEDAGEGKTQLLLVHDELPSSDAYDGHDDGWAEILRKLAEHLG